MWQLVIEAIIVGVLNIIFGTIVSYLFMGEKAKTFEHWNSLILSFFITGVLIHLFCELVGINKRYCKDGNACRKKNKLLEPVPLEPDLNSSLEPVPLEPVPLEPVPLEPVQGWKDQDTADYNIQNCHKLPCQNYDCECGGGGSCYAPIQCNSNGEPFVFYSDCQSAVLDNWKNIKCPV